MRDNEYSDLADSDLLKQLRAGESSAFEELWRRYSLVATRVAHNYTKKFDPDDLVSEAFMRILTGIRAGKGPKNDFRSYLLSTIRFTANEWGRVRPEISTDRLDEIPSGISAERQAIRALDEDLTLRAFRALPERWQLVLWQTAVEGRLPQEVAELLEMNANAVSAMSYRAREGLRQTWIQEHLRAAEDRPSCVPTISLLARFVRGALGARHNRTVIRHLETCEYCRLVADEARRVNHWLGAGFAVIGALWAPLHGAFSSARATAPTKSRVMATAYVAVPALALTVAVSLQIGSVTRETGAATTSPVSAQERMRTQPKSVEEPTPADDFTLPDGTFEPSDPGYPFPVEQRALTRLDWVPPLNSASTGESADDDVSDNQPLVSLHVDDGGGWVFPVLRGQSAPFVHVKVLLGGEILTETDADAQGCWVTASLEIRAAAELRVEYSRDGSVLESIAARTRTLDGPSVVATKTDATSETTIRASGAAGRLLLVQEDDRSPWLVRLDSDGAASFTVEGARLRVTLTATTEDDRRGLQVQVKVLEAG